MKVAEEPECAPLVCDVAVLVLKSVHQFDQRSKSGDVFAIKGGHVDVEQSVHWVAGVVDVDLCLRGDQQ